ncbi:hypothetical protein [Sulfurospirillum cavolei]|uniref:hypothetical protein n=1 Tax=Sulfurospirillum cavolei TaxID=366522 RepID=UPI0005A64B07|nr:hypothetical protein [Sulfurospirillum cavolei]
MNEFIEYIIHTPETLTALQKIGIAYIIFFILSYIFQKKMRLIVFILYAVTFFLYSLDWTIRKTDIVNNTPITTKKETTKKETTTIEPKTIKKEEQKNISSNPNIKIEMH